MKEREVSTVKGTTFPYKTRRIGRYYLYHSILGLTADFCITGGLYGAVAEDVRKRATESELDTGSGSKSDDVAVCTDAVIDATTGAGAGTVTEERARAAAVNSATAATAAAAAASDCSRAFVVVVSLTSKSLICLPSCSFASSL